jgi:hypothetical protein
MPFRLTFNELQIVCGNRKTHVPKSVAVGLKDAKIVRRLLDLVTYKAHGHCGTDNMRNNKPEFA